MRYRKGFFSRALFHYLVLLLVLISFTTVLAAEKSLKGQVSAVAVTIQTITVKHGATQINLKWTNDTVFQNIDVKKIREIQGQEIEAKYIEADGKNIATFIRLAIAEIPKGAKEIKTQELAKLIFEKPGSYVLIDARPAGRYRVSHIPTAISLPVAVMEKLGEASLPYSKDATLIFYCGGITCPLSPKAASLALKWGFKDVRVYLEGEPGWKKAGYYTESTPQHIMTENIVLIDLREPQVVEKTGYIPRAVNVPFSKLDEYEDKLPSYRKAPIVLYGDNKEKLIQAFKKIKEWGYPNVTVYSGGIIDWVFKGNDLKTGPISREVVYQRKYQPHEVTPQEFLKAVETGSAVIVDVRSPSEYQKGHFKRAINIPADEMGTKYTMLPKDKLIYLHCSTGVRAEMAYITLKEKCPTCNAKVLIAEVECEGEKCTISE